jgi:K+-sensing histidine kinase KdpD
MFFIVISIISYRNILEEIINPIKEIHESLKKPSNQEKINIVEFRDLFESIQENKQLSANKMIVGLINVVVHNVRKPMYMLSNSLDIVQTLSEFERDKYIKKVFPKIADTIDATDKMLASLTDLSLDNQLNLSSIDMKCVIEKSISCFAFSEDIRFEYNHIRNIKIDESKILQVFINIFSNIDDIMRKNPEIIVWVKTLEDDKYQTVIIGNTGSKIEKEKINDIFNKFYSNGKPSGRGLGLAVAKKFIEAHKGTIEAKSADHHVEFFIKIPI